MDYLNTPIDREEQMQQIIDDTDEIIKNFRDISEIIAEKIEHAADPMFNIGRKLIHFQERNEDSSSILGDEQINFIM